MKKRVLFIAYEFPPMNVGGSLRPAKLVKYLPDFEFEPVVITLSPDSYNKINRNLNIDYSLNNDLKTTIRYNIQSNNLKSLYSNKLKRFINIYFNLLKGNEGKMWKKNLFKAIPKIIKENKPVVIFVTAPPFSIIPLALKISKQFNLPIIIDMRDSFSGWVVQPYGSIIHYLLTKRKEKSWFKKASAIITVTNQLKNEWELIHPNIDKHNFYVIPNGADEMLNFKPFTIKIKDKFIIGYLGNFYYSPETRKQIFKPWYKKKLNRMIQYVPRKEDWLYRSPYFLFKTISYLIKKNPEYNKKIKLHFAGEKPKWFDNMVNEFNLENNVTHLGWLSHDKTRQFLNSCDAFLSTSVKVINGEDYCIAGKTFDYLLYNKPILGFVTEGSQKEFLKKSGIGIICDPDNIEISANKIKNLLENEVTFTYNPEFLIHFNRKKQAEKLARIIKNIIHNK